MRAIAGACHYAALLSAWRTLRPGGNRRGGAQVNPAWRPRDAVLTVPGHGGDVTQTSARMPPPASACRSDPLAYIQRSLRPACPGRVPHTAKNALPYGGAGTRLPRGSAPGGQRRTSGGRLAQRESASFTPRRSLVRSQYRPPSSAASCDLVTGRFGSSGPRLILDTP